MGVPPLLPIAPPRVAARSAQGTFLCIKEHAVLFVVSVEATGPDAKH